jgi:hypothetical protein
MAASFLSSIIDDSHRVVALLACPDDMKSGLPGAPGVV